MVNDTQSPVTHQLYIFHKKQYRPLVTVDLCLRMRLLCLTSNEFCTAADPADVRRQVEAHLEAAQRSRKAYPHSYRSKGYKVLHVGSGSFAKHDRRHHQSDHNYVWTVLDVRTPAVTPKAAVVPGVPASPTTPAPPKHPIDVYVACFQEMFVRSSLHPSQTKTARALNAVLRAHGLNHQYKVETKGTIVGEANLTSFGKRRKWMGLGVYVWSRTPLAEQTALTTATLHPQTRTSTKRMLRQVLVGSHFTLTVGNVHLPMKENLRMDGKGVDPTNPMRQQMRNAMLTKALHSMDVDHALKHEVTRRSRRRRRSRGGRHRVSRYRSRALYTLPASPESYASVVQPRDMLSGTDRDVPYEHPHVPAAWGDIVYEWLTRRPHDAFCPTCEFVHNRPLAKREDDTQDARGWNDVPEVPVDVKPKAWKIEAVGSSYRLIKKQSYNVPSYCDRVLVRVRPRGSAMGGGPHVQLLAGDMNYRIMPVAFIEESK